MRPGVVEFLATSAALVVICAGIVVWSKVQPKTPPPLSPAAQIRPEPKPDIRLIQPAAAAELKPGMLKTAAKKKPKRKPAPSVAQVPKPLTP